MGLPRRRVGRAGSAAKSEELARLRREKALLKKDNKELVIERGVFERCMVLWAK
ncbi:hypothetical protein ACWEKM_44000 [Streptomyces sp. NPDC004752]